MNIIPNSVEARDIAYHMHSYTNARAHMETNGASFAATQADIDSGVVLEQCDLCHASGRSAAVELVHPVR